VEQGSWHWHPSPTSYLIASREDGHGRCFKGDITEIVVFNEALEDSQVSAISESLRGNYGVLFQQQ